jgi:hypothetical protein
MFTSNDLNPADYANAEIQGYASLTSVNQGGTIDFHVRTINTNSYTLSVFRMGWYSGTGGRLMLGPVTLPGVVQPMPPAPVYQPSGTGIVECNWSVSYSLTIPTDWVSGVYLVKLSLSSPAKESYIVFVVRDDARNSPILFQSSVATYQAYNEWGGSSLYTTDSIGAKTGVKVSFNRPYWRNFGAGDFVSLNGAPGYEMQMVRWLESQGYDITYATDIDTHENPNTVLTHKVFLVVGHDEYWSRNMRDNVTQGRDAGVHLGIFASNVLFWQVRFEPSSTGIVDRTIVSYKELASMDPVSDPSLVTTRWRDLGEPEGELLGVQYNLFSAPTVSDIVVTNASHWLFDGTGVTNGTIFPNVEGYETDSLYPPSGATVLAHSPYPRDDPQVFGDMTIYTAGSGALVFATGTMEWSLGLDDFPPSQGIVPAMQQITANFLFRALHPPPILSFINPTSGDQGQNLSSVILTGSNFQSGATCSFGAGITVNSCTFNSATQFTASITIGAAATVGSRNVTVTNPDSQSSTLSNGFTVTTAGPPPPPTLSSINPNSGAQGQNLSSVILAGSNFQSGATCSFGAGIIVNSCAVNSATQLTASITIGSTAALGSRNVTVTNPDSQSSTLSNGFTVIAPPVISLIQKVTFSRQPASGGTVTLTLPQATGAGHTLIVGVSFWPLDITSVTDGSGDTFTRGLATSIYHDVSGSAIYNNFYYAKSIGGGTTSLTLNFSDGSTYLLVAVAEVAGLNSSTPLDQSGFHDSLTPTTAWSSAAVTTTAANEYLFSWAATGASNPFCSSPASGWTIETQFNDSSNGAAVCLLDRIVSAAGSYQTSLTASSAQNYAMEIVTFKSGSSSPPPPTLSSVNPSSGAQGQNLSSVILTGSNFQSGATCSFGAGITVNSCAVNSATQLTGNVTIGSTATLGSRNVTVTNPDSQSSTLSNGFTVTTAGPPPPPTLSSVNPTSGAQGQNLTGVILTGSNFQSGATCSFGAGITVNSCAFNSATQLTGNITIGSTATLGSRNITVTNPDSQSSTLSNSFTVTALPAISLIQKATFSRQPASGGTVTLTLPQATGAGHTLIVGVSFWPLDISSVTDSSGDTFTRGLATSIFHNVSGSAIYNNFYYAKSTAGGATSLTLNFSGGSTYLLVAVAEVAGLNSSTPLDQSGFHESLTSTTAWSSATVTTTTANEYLFSWAATGASNPSCSSPASGWTIESQTNSNGATVCLLDGIAPAMGSYQTSLTASSAQNYAMEIVTFKSGSSSPPPPPTLRSINPSSGNQGQNLNSVILTGSNFQSGATCSFGAGITVNSCAFNSATQLTGNVTIGSTATLGSRNVTVTNPDSQSSTLSNGFTVTTAGPPPPPTLSSVNPTSGAQGQNLTGVILTGSNFQSGATCSFGAGITVNSCAFNSATQLTGNITIGSTATLGSRNITVTNPDSQSSTLSNSFTVTALPAISLIQKATVSRQPTSGGTVTLTLPQATGAEHTLIVGVSFWPLDISSVTDSSGDTFTRGLATSIFHNVSGSAIYNNFYYAKSTAGGTTSLTLNFSGGSTYLLVAVAEVAGLNSSTPLDQSGFHESLTPTAAWSSAAVTTTAANEYLFSWAATGASNPSCSSPASGWTIESQTNDSSGATVCLLDRIVSAAGSYQTSLTASSAQNYAMEIVTFH